MDSLKVAQHTWIKILKSKQNSLIMKVELTNNRYTGQKAKETYVSYTCNFW